MKRRGATRWIGALVVLLVTVGGALALSKPVREAEAALKAAARQGNIPAVEAAVARLVSIGDRDAARVLLTYARKTPPGAERIYWRLLDGAASLTDEEALGELARTIVRDKRIGRDLLFALQNNRSRHVPEVVLRPVLDKGSDELRLMAADQLGQIESVEAVDVLIWAYQKYERRGGELVRRLVAGLQSLTGADLGAASNWAKWWEEARKDGLARRKREGESTGTVVDEMPPTRWDEVGALRKLRPEQVWVVIAECEGDRRRCNYDDMDAVLNDMNVPHIVVTRKEIEKKQRDLKQALVILLTCVQIHDHCVCPKCKPSGGPTTNRMTQCTGCDVHIIRNHSFSADAVARLKAWVEAGGYLFSEDWGLADMLERAWPKKVRTGAMMKHRVVEVTPARGAATHPLLRGVFLDPAAARRSQQGETTGTVARGADDDAAGGRDGITRVWTIDDDSPFIHVLDPSVTVLMESDALAKEGGREERAVAITFLPGGGVRGERQALRGRPEAIAGGRVLHVLSHFGKQHTRRDEFALQNLLLNFLLEANRRFQMR
ncbi:MAG: hypothetical protein D6776_04095 [Planctomycetota bacterium]|nr:MAG: hypothetical protein D6776_04095 [Planctomycetota bacterium]